MRKPRHGLRPVTYTQNRNDKIEAYFHCFGQEGNLEEGVGMYATIELKDGTVTQVDAYKIRFDDVENTDVENTDVENTDVENTDVENMKG